jgi:hypothetical protein
MKLRIIPHRGKEMKGRWVAIVDGKELFGGETLELEGADAQHLVDVGAAEIVKHLPPKKKQAEPEPALSGREAG